MRMDEAAVGGGRHGENHEDHRAIRKFRGEGGRDTAFPHRGPQNGPPASDEPPDEVRVRVGSSGVDEGGDSTGLEVTERGVEAGGGAGAEEIGDGCEFGGNWGRWCVVVW